MVRAEDGRSSPEMQVLVAGSLPQFTPAAFMPEKNTGASFALFKMNGRLGKTRVPLGVGKYDRNPGRNVKLMSSSSVVAGYTARAELASFCSQL
jgi:hypothetical protein